MAVDPPVIRFGSADTAIGAGIVMQTDEDGALVPVRQGHPVIQIDEMVAPADENDPELPL